MKKLFVIVAVILVALLASGCTGTGMREAGKLTVLDHELIKEAPDNVTVRVTVKNTGSVVAELAKVTVNFYDAGKNLIDSSSDSVLNLMPGETWEFNIKYQGARGSEVRSYDIETLAGTSSGGL